MKVISQQEFHSNPAEVLEGVEAGETYQVTDHGKEVLELHPPAPGRHMTTDEVIELLKDQPEMDYAEMRAEADAFFGIDRIDDDPWERSRG